MAPLIAKLIDVAAALLFMAAALWSSLDIRYVIALWFFIEASGKFAQAIVLFLDPIIEALKKAKNAQTR